MAVRKDLADGGLDTGPRWLPELAGRLWDLSEMPLTDRATSAPVRRTLPSESLGLGWHRTDPLDAGLGVDGPL